MFKSLVEIDNKLIRTIEFWTLLFGTRSRNYREDVSTLGTNRLSHYIDCLSCSDRYLFVMKSRRKSVAVRFTALTAKTGQSDAPLFGDDSATSDARWTTHKQYKATAPNKYSFRFYGRHPCACHFITVRKVALSREHAVVLSRRLVGWDAASKQWDDRQQEEGR